MNPQRRTREITKLVESRGRDRVKQRVARIGWLGFGLTSILVALITLTPQSDTSAHGTVSAAILTALHQLGVPMSFGEVQWEFTANIIMFTPLGFFLALTLLNAPVTGKRIAARLVGLPLISVFIETTQFLLLPSRYPTWSDIIANSLGGWLGFAAGWLIVLWMLRSHDHKSSGKQTVAVP